MIINKTKNKIIAKDFLKKTGLGKLKGLIGEKGQKAVVFTTRFGIHTFFLKLPIDLIVLDSENRIVFIRRGVKPNRIVVWNIKFNTVIELPFGSLKKSKTEKGDIIHF